MYTKSYFKVKERFIVSVLEIQNWELNCCQELYNYSSKS
jgi:hypothetical protein